MVSIVTIKSLTKLYKDNQEANSIELANVEEHGYDIVVQKNLYNIGDKALYVQPDFCLPLPIDGVLSIGQKIFNDFTSPMGDIKKSKLGKNGRIRAIKFNFTKDVNSTEPIYSMGIILPLFVVANIMDKSIDDVINIVNETPEVFEITKYEEPETGHSGLSKGSLPVGIYKTDETTIENLMSSLDWILPTKLTGSLKVDGSSITIYYKDENNKGICSRSLEKYLEQKYVSGYISGDDKLRKHFNRETNKNGWFSEKNNIFYDINSVPEGYEEIFTEVEDSFVKLGLPVLNKLSEYCLKNNKRLALRGELCGQGLKGSGNKNNPHSNIKQTIKFYGLDFFNDNDMTRKLPLSDFYSLCNELGLETCDVIFEKTFNDYNELRNECNAYFKNNMIEGIVVRNEEATFSAKVMNLEYDSKK